LASVSALRSKLAADRSCPIARDSSPCARSIISLTWSETFCTWFWFREPSPPPTGQAPATVEVSVIASAAAPMMNNRISHAPPTAGSYERPRRTIWGEERFAAASGRLLSVARELGFGILPANELADARTLLAALCQNMAAATGLPFAPRIATGFGGLAAGLENGDLALAWLPPLPTIDLDSRAIASVLAIPARRGATSYHAAFIVRRGGPKTLEALKGRRAAWVHRDSAAGYLIPRLHLAAKGFEVLRYFSRELFVNTHAAVVEAVVQGEADVGATFCNVDPASGNVVRGAWLDGEGEPIRPIDAITTIGPIPNDALVASAHLPAADRSALTRWLLSLQGAQEPEKVHALELFERLLGATDFRVAATDHYEELRHAVRAARARGYDTLPPDSRRRMRVGR
jgi:phosphonate transport system substrate-binding protein